jgi:DNA/RNA-binding domain of Phe-tRNA-synthetase-like protein
MNTLITATDAWRSTHPGAALGVLALRGVTNPARHPALDARKAALEQSLRERYGGLDRAALAQLPVLQAYAAYYKRFKKWQPEQWRSLAPYSSWLDHSPFQVIDVLLMYKSVMNGHDA